MPQITVVDEHDHGSYVVPGGGPYRAVEGTPTLDRSIPLSGGHTAMLVDPAAALENVQYDYPAATVMPWRGFFFRIETEPASSCEIARLFAAAGANGNLGYLSSSNHLYHYITGAAFPASPAFGPGVEVWVEQIFKVDEATRRLRTRVYQRSGGVWTPTDLTALDEAVAASTVTHHGVGSMGAADTWVGRYGTTLTGVAASLTDWLGPPAPPDTRHSPALAHDYSR